MKQRKISAENLKRIQEFTRSKMKIVIIMPTYNAAKTIESVFSRIPRTMLKKIYRFIIVNDGSCDDTLDKINKLEKNYEIDLLNHIENKGYGAAQKKGYKHALKLKADVVILLHADGQYAPEVMGELLEPIEKNKADVVQGSRILGGGAIEGGMPIYKYIGNRLLTWSENKVYGMNMKEYHSGYLLYSKKALVTIPFETLSDKFHFDAEMLMVAQKKGLRIMEVPIPTKYADEASHLKPITYSFEVFKAIINYYRGKYNF